MRCKSRVKYLLPWSILHNLNTCSPMWKRKGSNSLRNSGETIYVDWTERLVSCFVGWATCKPYFSQYRHLWCFAEKSGDIFFFKRTTSPSTWLNDERVCLDNLFGGELISCLLHMIYINRSIYARGKRKDWHISRGDVSRIVLHW